MRTSCGLPCAHEMSVLLNNHTPIDVNDIHVFCRTLEMEGRGGLKNEDERKLASDQIDELVGMMKERPEEQQQYFANAMYRLLHPESTDLKQPMHRPHKGRPKSNPTKEICQDGNIHRKKPQKVSKY